MKFIQKIKLHNFKRFGDIEIPCDERLNILIGDNESGKSSILMALDLVCGGSRSRVETLGLQSLLNAEAVNTFLTGDRKLQDLPTMYAEIYLNDQNIVELNGKCHSEKDPARDGLRLTCQPIDDFGKAIQEILDQDKGNFPFEYYSIKFETFAGQPYSGYRKFMRHLLIDSSQINNEYATRDYIKTIYEAHVDDSEKFKNQNEYRRHKTRFTEEVLADVNSRLDDYEFSIKTGTKSSLESDLTITEDDIPIESKGKGRQCFIKTEFALKKGTSEHGLDALLLEEPENHLSHVNMKKLIQKMAESTEKQLFIATHSNLISTRLDLRKSIMLSNKIDTPTLLTHLPEDTAKFFIKAPDNNILEFVLSSNVILVEGDAEYILIDAFYRNRVGSNLESSDIHVISVGGTSFKRFLDLAALLNIKTAVIRDNDGDVQQNCVDNYQDYVSDNIKIFYEKDSKKRTFEFCLYAENKGICDGLFRKGRRTLSVIEYVLQNKADVAFQLLNNESQNLAAPGYIDDAIVWIKQ